MSTTKKTSTTPTHKLPTSCYVCGAPAATEYRPHACTACSQYLEPCGAHADSRPDCAHNLTNAEAFAAADEYDRRTKVALPSMTAVETLDPREAVAR